MSRILAEYLVEYDSSQTRTGESQINTFRKKYLKQSGFIILIEKHDKKIFFRWNPLDEVENRDRTKGLISSPVDSWYIKDNVLTVLTTFSKYKFKLKQNSFH